MPRLFKAGSLLAMLALALGVVPAHAGFIATVTPTITSQGGGVSLYSYTVADSPTSTSSISEFDLSLTRLSTMGIVTPVGAPIASITMPTGFINTYTLGDPVISFFSTDPSTDLMPGGRSATFSFTSSTPALLQPYQFVDLSTGLSTSGMVIAPATVPEPTSVVLFGLGALSVLGLYARGRRRVTTA